MTHKMEMRINLIKIVTQCSTNRTEYIDLQTSHILNCYILVLDISAAISGFYFLDVI